MYSWKSCQPAALATLYLLLQTYLFSDSTRSFQAPTRRFERRGKLRVLVHFLFIFTAMRLTRSVMGKRRTRIVWEKQKCGMKYAIVMLLLKRPGCVRSRVGHGRGRRLHGETHQFSQTPLFFSSLAGIVPASRSLPERWT